MKLQRFISAVLKLYLGVGAGPWGWRRFREEKERQRGRMERHCNRKIDISSCKKSP